MAVAATALLFHPYMGLSGDGRIYVGRGLADLDPGGIGRDLMFAYDRQSAFSLFPPLLRRVVAALGPANGTLVVSAVALAAWTAAAFVLLRGLFGRAGGACALLALLILPTNYGGFELKLADPSPLPRPFAEALVLLALWALNGRRLVLCGALLAVAAALHPIMALGGVAVVAVVLCLEDRRWLLVGGAGALAVALGAALRLPLFGRLLDTMDQRWLAVLHICSPGLFLGLWSKMVWALTLAQVATVALAAAWLGGRPRRILLASLVVGVGSVAASAALGDFGHDVLVVQAQPWRCLWLPAFLAAACAPTVALRLVERGPSGRLALGLLAGAWGCVVLPPLSICLLALGVGLIVHAEVLKKELPRPALFAGWVIVGTVLAYVAVGETLAIVELMGGAPLALRLPLHTYLLQDACRVAAAALVIVALWKLAPVLRRADPGLVAAAACAVLAFALVNWDASEGSRRMLISPEAGRQVRAIVASRPGAVEWLAGDLEPVMLAHRPAWQTEVQAASSVFSRDQALEWERRARLLVATGAGPPVLLARFPHLNPPAFWAPSPQAVRRFCGQPDAPAWLVQGIAPGAAPPPEAIVWDSGWSQPRTMRADGPVFGVSRYAFVPCGRPEVTVAARASSPPRL